MPVAHYHLRAKPIGKSGSTNAVAAAAYRSGSRGVVASAAYRAAERLREDGGRVYGYTNKKGVEEAFILVPEDAPIWASDRGKLWNAAEAFEKRLNGRVATELEISLPKELNSEQRRELIVGFVRILVDRYKVAADVALHIGSDPRNLHAHVQLTHREIGPAGFGDIAGRHTVIRKGKEIPVAGFVATPRDVIKLRKLWENDVNAAYRKAGLNLTVDSRSYQEQGLDIRPQLYLGPERKDNPELEQKRQQRADYNKRIIASRAEREQASLDAAHDQRHDQPLRQAQEDPQSLPRTGSGDGAPRTADVIKLKRPAAAGQDGSEQAPDPAWFAALVAGWAAPPPPPPRALHSELPEDPLAHDLTRAIADALGARDPEEQTQRLAAGVDRAVFVHGGNPDELPSALSGPEPEAVLIRSTGEAIRRHELRQRQGEIAREPAEDVPTLAQDAPPPDPRLITDRAELKRLQREAGYSSQLGVARDLVPGFRDLEGRRKEVLVEQRNAEVRRQVLGRERDDALKAEQAYHQGLSWWQHKLTEWKIVRDDNIPALRQAVTEAEAKLAAHLESETTLQARLTAIGAAMTVVLDRVAPTVAAHDRIGEIARRRLREHYKAEHEAGRKPGLAQWQEKERPMDETKPPLYERYKTERDTAYAERQAAENELYARFAAYEQDLRGWYNVQFEQEKGSGMPGHARRDAIQILSAMQRGDRVETRRLRDQQLFEARKAHPLPDWENWLKREAERGEPEAVRAVERRRAQEMEYGLER